MVRSLRLLLQAPRRTLMCGVCTFDMARADVRVLHIVLSVLMCVGGLAFLVGLFYPLLKRMRKEVRPRVEADSSLPQQLSQTPLPAMSFAATRQRWVCARPSNSNVFWDPQLS